jgi:hypothetical protein
LSKELPKNYNQLLPESGEGYGKIEPFLKVYNYSKGTVLRPPGEVEPTVRFIYSGVMALFLPASQGREYRLRIFGQGNVASDLSSYFHAALPITV